MADGRIPTARVMLIGVAVVFGAVLVPAAINIGTGGSLPGPLAGFEPWAWPAVGMGLVVLTALGVLEFRRSSESVRAYDHPRNRPNALAQIENYVTRRLGQTLAEQLRLTLALEKVESAVLPAPLLVQPVDEVDMPLNAGITDAFDSFQETQKCGDLRRFGNEPWSYPVHPRSARALGPRHPSPCHSEEIRVTHEVEQVVKPATSIADRPLVQFGLHPTCPKPCRIGVRPRLTTIQWCLRPSQSLANMNPLDPFAMWTAFPSSDYYESSAPPSDRQRTSRLSASTATTSGRYGDPKWFPRSLCFDCRARCPAISPRHRHGYAADFHRDLPNRRPEPAQEFPGHHEHVTGCAPRSSPYPPNWSWRET